jgi:hypothetical protein
MAGGGFTVSGGTPSIRCSGQSRGTTVMVAVVRRPSGVTIPSACAPLASRPTPNTTEP